MSGIYPTAASLAFRAQLAEQVSPLSRVRSRTPFFRLDAHRIPTLWSLYRGLMRSAPTDDVRFRVRAMFRQNRALTGVERTVKMLEQGYKWLDYFKKAMEGDIRRQNVMMRYSRLIVAKRAKADMWRLLKGELESQLRMRTRPIYTGGFVRPTIYHGPLPRMKPQPEHISMMIKNRMRARERRHRLKAQLLEDMNDLALEQQFEDGLRAMTSQSFPTTFSNDTAVQEWSEPIKDSLKEISAKEKKEYARASTPFPPSMVSSIFEARREKIRNKTREKERERRGELTLSAIRRRNKGPPAPVLALMTPEQRKLDKAARSLSEVGYAALAKRRLGRAMKDPEAGLELGRAENRPLLDMATEAIRNENKKRAAEESKSVRRGVL